MMRLLLALLLVPSLALSATGQKVGTPSEYDVSARKVTATGSTTARSLAARAADVIRAADFGVACDADASTGSGTDDTVKLQQAINKGAETGKDVILPATALGKACRFSRLFFYYDAGLNPGWPSGYAGKAFRVIGVGQAGVIEARYPEGAQRTTLISTDPTGPALNFDGGAGFATFAFEVGGFNLTATNSTSVIFGKRFNAHAKLKDLTAYQKGAGGGIYLEDLWVGVGMENVGAHADTAVLRTTGTAGIWLKNTVGAGAVELRKTVATGFEYGYVFGAWQGASAGSATLATVVHSNSDAEQNRVGYYYGEGVQGIVGISPHHEANTEYGTFIGAKASSVTTIGEYCNEAATYAIYIETTGTVASNGGREIINPHLVIPAGAGKYGIYVEGDTNLLGGGIQGGKIIASGGGGGVGIRMPAIKNGWTVRGVAFSNFSATTNVQNSQYLALYSDYQGNTLSSGAAFSALSVAAAGAIAGSSVDAGVGTATAGAVALRDASGAVFTVGSRSDGRLATSAQAAAENRLKYSSDFSNAIWTKSAAASIDSSPVAGYDGTLIAQTLHGSGAGASVYTFQTAPSVNGTTYVFSVDAERVDWDWYRLRVDDGSAIQAGAYFNLGTGQAGSTFTSGGGTIVSASMTRLRNPTTGALTNIYRLAVVVTVTWGSPVNLYAWISAVAGDLNGTGPSGATNARISRAQVATGSAVGPYVATTAAATIAPSITAQPIPVQAAAHTDSAAADVATLKTDFNALLAKMRTAGILAP
jgi:hypothetical protein